MDVHSNARLTPKGREAMVLAVVENGLSHAAAARQFNTTPKTVAKWVKRFGHGGVEKAGHGDLAAAPIEATANACDPKAELLARLRWFASVPENIYPKRIETLNAFMARHQAKALRQVQQQSQMLD
jgi:transposase-like protein